MKKLAIRLLPSLGVLVVLSRVFPVLVVEALSALARCVLYTCDGPFNLSL